jgi:hypothetical protein
MRLTSLLSGEDLSKLSLSELKDFVRNLPLTANAAEGFRRTGHTPGLGASTTPTVSSATADETIQGGTNLEETNLEETNLDETNLDETNLDETNLDETNLDETNLDETNLDETNLDETNLDETTTISSLNIPLRLMTLGRADSNLLNGNSLHTVEDKSEDSISLNSFLPESLAAGLLLAANVAGTRGWKLGRLSDEDKVIQGNLDELRKMQSSRKYSIWQKQNTENHSNY